MSAPTRDGVTGDIHDDVHDRDVDAYSAGERETTEGKVYTVTGGDWDSVLGAVEDEAEHAVRRGVLRPHVDDEALRAGGVDAEGLVPVPAGDGVDAALGGLAGPGVGVVGGAHR